MSVKRAQLLPTVLKRNPYFVDLLDATDEVFKGLDAKLENVSAIYNPYFTNDLVEQKIAAGDMIDFRDWPVHQDIKLQLSHMGIPAKDLNTAELVEDGKLLALWTLARYWRQKRRKAKDFTEFTNNKKWLTSLT